MVRVRHPLRWPDRHVVCLVRQRLYVLPSSLRRSMMAAMKIEKRTYTTKYGEATVLELTQYGVMLQWSHHRTGLYAQSDFETWVQGSGAKAKPEVPIAKPEPQAEPKALVATP